MGQRRKIERREFVEQRWPRLFQLMACHFNQDLDIMYGSLEGAFATAVADGPLEHRRAILKELRDWKATEGEAEDIRRLLNAFGVDLLFKAPQDARDFIDPVYDELLAGVKAETSTG
jgi:hypothetical protein